MQLEEFREKYKYSTATVVMQQFLDIKFAHFDCLLLFRMGDFYELFYEDAVVASKVLGITLTKRGKNGDDAIEMCGVPFHALENYLHKLLEDGFKVAICDQLETPEEAKKRGGYKAVVTRGVVRIVTPGTIIEESLLEGGVPHYLASLVIIKNMASICYADLSTSEIFTISLPESELVSELARLKPKELLLAEKYRSSELARTIERQLNLRISFLMDNLFAQPKCERIILDFYKIKSLSGIGGLNEGQVSAIGTVLEYLSLTQKANLPNLPKPRIVFYDKFMNIDAATRRNLEINTSLNGSKKGSLFDCLDYTMSKTGTRLLYHFLSAPLIDIDQINQRLEITEFFYNNLNLTDKIRASLKNIGDMERSLARLNMKKATPADLLNIKNIITIAEEIREFFVTMLGSNLPTHTEQLTSALLGNQQIRDLIADAIADFAPNILSDGGVIKPSYHPKLQELQDLIENSKNHIDNLRDKYRAETSVESLKISNNNVIGLFIDITSRNIDKITGDHFIHRQTTANSVRYTTLELQDLEGKMINAKSTLVSLEREIFENICNQIVENMQLLLALSNSLAHIDVFTNFAYLADLHNYSRPTLSEDLSFYIEGGRHPVVETALAKQNISFMANDCKLSMEERIWLITGPNMAGKSTFLRQNALIAIMAHIGSFVPTKSAIIGIVDKIFSRIGAGDDLAKGQSTFMVEMLETAAILAQGTSRSLIILDEVGRGTSTYDGVAIAWSTLEHIADKLRSRCLFATHYYELVAMEEIMPALRNYTIEVEENDGKILFLHRIKRGSASRSYGICVAELAGLPKSVIKRANELLKKFEKESSKSKSKIMQNESCNMNLFEV